MEALATVPQLAERLPFVMDEDETREATGALDDLSDDARHYGSGRWLTAADAPHQVINLVLKAAGRHMKNPDGFTTSRAGDETVMWTDKGEESGAAYFTPAEVARLKELGGYRRTGFHSVGVFAYGREDRQREISGLVPVQGGGDPFPLFAGDEPW